jgi:hypothetical protein
MLDLVEPNVEISNTVYTFISSVFHSLSEQTASIKMSDGYGSIPSGALTQPVPFHAFIAEDRVAELQQLVKLGKVAPPTYESTQEKYNYGINHQWLTDAKAAWLDFDWYVQPRQILECGLRLTWG